jgi:D-sedoheptulose 7-phosphate isomerase
MINNFFKNYFKEIYSCLDSLEIEKFRNFVNKIKKLKKNNKIIIVGNGGSASIAAHSAVDFTKVLKIRSVTFNESNLITCFANDYGYENWVKKAIEFYALKGDILILISSSGKSQNLINACRCANKIGVLTVTFTGFQKNNPLSRNGKINFWINSKVYNIVEMTQHICLVGIVDLLKK